MDHVPSVEPPIMSTTIRDFGAILVERGILSNEQLIEAHELVHQTGAKLMDILIKLGYATCEEIMRAKAVAHGVQYIDLTNIEVPVAVIEVLPESVARENIVLPLAASGQTIIILMSDPADRDMVQK